MRNTCYIRENTRRKPVVSEFNRKKTTEYCDNVLFVDKNMFT